MKRQYILTMFDNKLDICCRTEERAGRERGGRGERGIESVGETGMLLLLCQHRKLLCAYIVFRLTFINVPNFTNEFPEEKKPY